jgi:hypothetical protein
MKHKLLLLTLLAILSTTSYAQKSIEFTTIKENTAKKKIEKLLIAGVGTTPARIFLENLAEELGKDLKSKNIQSEYQYLGSDLNVANEELGRLLKDSKYKTVLIINEADTAFVDRRGGSSGYVSLPTGSFTPSIPILYSPLLKKRSKLYFEQEYIFRLFESNQSVSFWDGLLNVYSDISKKAVYSNVSNKIIKSFSQNAIL